MRFGGKIRLGQRSYLSTWMLRSSLRFAEQAQALEDEHPGDWSSPHAEEHMDLVISSVLNAATFMEAMVNELFTDASDDHGLTGAGYLAPLDANTIRLMKDWWDESNEGFEKVLVKYQLLLSFAGEPKLDHGTEPFQSAQLLVGLRNHLTHWRPETVWGSDVHRFEKRLGGRFPDNALISSASSWWPNRALGAGCAYWAATSARALADTTADRLGLNPNYQRILTEE